MNNFTKTAKIYIDNDPMANKAFMELLEHLTNPPIMHAHDRQIAIIIDHLKHQYLAYRRPENLPMPYGDLLNNAIAEIDYRELAEYYLS